MERLELIVVQLEEAKGMIEKGRVPNLRVAYLLIDSVTELILPRTLSARSGTSAPAARPPLLMTTPVPARPLK